MAHTRRTPQRRRLSRALVALVALGALWVLPSATGEVVDPADPGAPGSADPIPITQCATQPITRPKSFVEPDHFPTTAPCTRAYVDSTDPPINFSTDSQYAGTVTLGVQGAPHLAQWVKIPTVFAAAVVPIHTVSTAVNPPGEAPDTVQVFYFDPLVYFLSRDRKTAGVIPPFAVRSVAFGSLPVEVTVNITQPLDSDGSVAPVQVHTANPTYTDGSQLVRDSYGTGRLEVRLSNLRIDGHRVDLGERCATQQPATIRLHGTGYRGPTPDPGDYNPTLGGILHGTLDVPAFSGCRSAQGDDLSPLLTNAISGDGNPLTISQGRGGVPTCYPLNSPRARRTCLADLKTLRVPTAPPTMTTVPQQPTRVPRGFTVPPVPAGLASR